MYIEEWANALDQDNEWIEEWNRNQEVADRTIFRDQCRSEIEDSASFTKMITWYWENGEWGRAHAALSAVVMTTDSPDLIVECMTLANLSFWRDR